MSFHSRAGSYAQSYSNIGDIDQAVGARRSHRSPVYDLPQVEDGPKLGRSQARSSAIVKVREAAEDAIRRLNERMLTSEMSHEQLGDSRDGQERSRWLQLDRAQSQGVIAVLILVNMWALAMETDQPNWPWWGPINGFFLVLYIAEFAIRLVAVGPRVLLWMGNQRRWMMFDLLVLCLGAMDLWVSWLSPLSESSQPEAVPLEIERGGPDPPLGAPENLVLVRCMMFTRLLRCLRVFRMHSSLYDCVKLLMGMVSTFVWILSVIFTLCFVLAIVLTSLIGHGLMVDTEDPVLSEQVTAMFADIPTSFFTLFQLTTSEDWSAIAAPMVMLSSAFRLFFVCFITIMSWTMLSMLSALASDAMLLMKNEAMEVDRVEADIAKHKFTIFLCSEFVAADADGNNTLDRDEFLDLMRQTRVWDAIRAHGIHLQEDEVAQTWDTFDIDESGELTIDELITGFSYMLESLGMKHLSNMIYSLKRFSVRADTNAEGLDRFVSALTKQQCQVSDSIHLRLERKQALLSQFMMGSEPVNPDDHLPRDESSTLPGAGEKPQLERQPSSSMSFKGALASLKSKSASSNLRSSSARSACGHKKS